MDLFIEPVVFGTFEYDDLFVRGLTALLWTIFVLGPILLRLDLELLLEDFSDFEFDLIL